MSGRPSWTAVAVAVLAGGLFAAVHVEGRDCGKEDVFKAGNDYSTATIAKNCTTLDLRWKRIGASGATALADALKVNTALTSLELYGNNIGDSGATALADALKVNTALTSLSLSSNDIGASGATALADALKVNTALTSLDLQHNSIGASGATALADALKVNNALTSLDLWENNIGASGTTALADALKVNNALTSLDLQWNSIGASDATALADALKVNTALTSLNLQWNSIGDSGAAALADALKVNTALTALGLLSNSIGDSGATALADALKVNTALTELELGYNNKIGASILTAIADALKVNTGLCHGKTRASFCNNRGTPTKSGNTCVCTSCDGGYSGTRCETYNPCHQKTSSSFCNSHGTPSKKSNTCVCTSCDGGYSGAKCETYNPCHKKTSSSFCNSRGTPTKKSNTCVCKACDGGYSGAKCETYDPCYKKTRASYCNSRGTPTPNTASTKCICISCTDGYTGNRCKSAPAPKCSSGSVMLDGKCKDDCGSGFFASDDEPAFSPGVKLCKRCDVQCRRGCFGPGPAACEGCKFFHRTAKADGQTVCVEECPDGESPGDDHECYDLESSPMTLWLQRHKLHTYAAIMHREKITFKVLVIMTAAELKDDLGIKTVGDRKRVMAAIQKKQKEMYEDILALLVELDLNVPLLGASSSGGGQDAGNQQAGAGRDPDENDTPCPFSNPDEFAAAFEVDENVIAIKKAFCLECTEEEYQEWLDNVFDDPCVDGPRAHKMILTRYHPDKVGRTFPACKAFGLKTLKTWATASIANYLEEVGKDMKNCKKQSRSSRDEF